MDRDQITHVTFDCYGTLIDWETGIVEAFQSETEKAGLSVGRSEIMAAYLAEEARVESGGYIAYREVLAQTARRVAARLRWEVREEEAGFLSENLANWKPFPDANPALERLAQRFKLGILSNIDDDLLAATREHLSVPFDLVITAQQVGSYKPGPAHFQAAVDRVGRKGLLHVAQSYYHDVAPARSLDIPVIWVNRKGESTAPGGPTPTYEVRDLGEAADLLCG